MEETKEKKKCNLPSKKAVIITTAVIIAILILITVIALIASKQKDKIKFNGESNGIKYSANMKANSDVLVVMKNETGKTVSEVELIVTYYDANGDALSQQTSTTDVYIKNEEITLNSVNSDIIEIDKINNYKIEIKPKYYEGEDRLSNYEKIEISDVQDNGENIKVKVRNKTENTISHVCFYAVFFKDGVPVNLCANDQYSLKGEKEIEFKKPEDKDGNKIDYDFCKVYIKY